MCGIFGMVGPQGLGASKQELLLLLKNMARVMAHRGPDDEGFWVGKNAAFGMCRLSIIDVAGGHQPIGNEDETIFVVCNGEIYNFRELRTEMEGKGHVFRTQSDTEVIVHLYEEEGQEFFKRLRGMFALALWDASRKRLILGRDRLGKKPLYIRQETNRLLFASEVKSILQDERVSCQINFQALNEYLALGYVPAPLSLFDGIQKVLPGHFLVFEKGELRDFKYWDMEFEPNKEKSENEWIELVNEKLWEAIQIRMVSDVPLGAFLSGGIDSSAIVAVMAKLSSQPVKTYSIGFEGEDSFYNELPYASMVAKQFKTDHHEIIVRPEVSELLPKLIWHLDEPIADSAFITTYLVASLAQKEVKVVLSGVGGDELFGGYRRYLGEGLQHYYKLLPFRLRTKWIPNMLGRLSQDRHSSFANMARYGNAFFQSAEWSAEDRYLSYIQVFSREAREQIFQNGDSADPCSQVSFPTLIRQYFNKFPNADTLSQALYVDMKTALVDDLLSLTDKATMAASIECRAPFLDHELVELACRIPSQLKVRGFTLKYILKKALAPLLPKEILYRSKRGFGAPMGAWFRKDLRSLIHDTLSEKAVKKRGLFDWDTVRVTIQSHENFKRDHTDHLLALVNLELWCRIFLDGNGWKYAQVESDALQHPLR